MIREARQVRESGWQAVSIPMKVCFFFNAQIHQLPHALPLAVELARDPQFEVDIIASTDEHLTLAREIAAAMDATGLHFIRLGGPLLDAMTQMTGQSIPPKLPALWAARGALRPYDAIVLPERTSLLLRYLGLGDKRFIHTCHGAGDRAVGYDRRIRHFDFVLLAGEKQKRRMLEKGLIRDGHYAITGYGKFDATASRPVRSPFAQDRPTILYNPHFSRRLSSWPDMGRDILTQFADDDRFNLIFAPHLRLFDNRRRRAQMEAQLAEFACLPHIHIDLGSRASVDMSYVRLADLYLGDVSSQIYEYLTHPRPCLFLNGHQAQWRGNASYGHWRYGPVLEDADNIVDAAEAAIRHHGRYELAQRQGIGDTFGSEAAGNGVRASVRAARAVADFLRRSTSAGDARYAVGASYIGGLRSHG